MTSTTGPWPPSDRDASRGLVAWTVGFVLANLVVGLGDARSAEPAKTSAASKYREVVEPILADHCYGCHGNGIKKGSVTLDAFANDDSILARPELWHDVLKNVRAGLMPPSDKPRLSTEEMKSLEDWIKRQAFHLDPEEPDPGRVTLRRLNRVEYRNTVRDLTGFDFRADEEFPADDSGYGFDNIGDVLSVSPLLLEKYMQAAEAIVKAAVPVVSRVTPTQVVTGRDFGADRMSFYTAATKTKSFDVAKSGPHRLILDLSIRGNFNFDPGRARVIFKRDDVELVSEEFGWEDGRKAHYEWDLSLDAGKHAYSVEVKPLVPVEKKQTSVDLQVASIKLEGPLGDADRVHPPGFDRFFDRDDPLTPEGRKAYAREVVARFATKAFRRPVDPRTLDRLVAIAEAGYRGPGRTVEQGIARAFVAVLASPRFLFRIEDAAPAAPGRISSPLDDFALASRLSYFFWSTMPDDELIGLASRGELRKNLEPQVKRMVADGRFGELVRNFTGQWLQSRDFEHFPIQHKPILRRDGLPGKMDGEVDSLRRNMKVETERYFGHVVREDRPLLELIDSDYAIVNQALAKLYGIPGVEGQEFRKVTLPPGSPRGGMLTQAGVLMITSNPSRTSPVKRGQFVLENFLGSPTPPPPPDIPSLEDTIKGLNGQEPTMRQVMEVHRANALCASCHARMDPLGLAFENFNALGIFRETERKQPIDTSGKLVSGRTFKTIGELKAILKTENKLDFYRCMTEKLLTYALGRGVDYYDVETIDQIVDRIEKNDGKFSALLMGVVESAPFQKRRVTPAVLTQTPKSSSPNQGSNP